MYAIRSYYGQLQLATQGQQGRLAALLEPFPQQGFRRVVGLQPDELPAAGGPQRHLLAQGLGQALPVVQQGLAALFGQLGEAGRVGLLLQLTHGLRGQQLELLQLGQQISYNFV